MYLLAVEHDTALFDVLGSFFVDLSLEGHLREGDTIDGQKEGICEHGIIQNNLPVELAVLELDWEQIRLSKLFAIKFE